MGGMYKVGTGDCGTVAGKVYLFLQSDKESPGAWVFCKGKLYLHRTCDEPGLLRVICPDTFQKIGTVKLSCSDAFKDSSAAKLNRNMPILTDGESLFAIVVNFKAVKRTVKKEKQDEYTELKKAEEEVKRKEVSKAGAKAARKKEDKKKSSPSDTARICEFFLVEFDITKHQEESDKLPEPVEEALIDELCETFSGYFSKKECMYALRMNAGDMENAGRWLIDEGENERGKTVVRDKRWVLLAQSVVQEGQETEVVDGSVLIPHYLTSGQWTMNKSQVALHLAAPTAKVFSSREEDVKVLDSKATEPGTMPKQQRQHRSEEENEEGEEDSEGERRPPKEQPPSGDQPPVVDFFEGTELRGSFICSVVPEYFDYDRTAMTYSSGTSKFYVLSMDSSSICTLLEYGNMSGVNMVTLPEVLKKRFENKPGVSSPAAVAEALLMFLKESEGSRYSLPTKWNNWDTLYSKMSESIAQKQANSRSAPQGISKKQEARLVKLRKKAENFHELQREAWIKALDLPEDQLQIPQSIPSSRPSNPNPNPWRLPPGASNHRPRYLPRGSGGRGEFIPSLSPRGSLFSGGRQDFRRPPPEFLREDDGDVTTPLLPLFLRKKTKITATFLQPAEARVSLEAIIRSQKETLKWCVRILRRLRFARQDPGLR